MFIIYFCAYPTSKNVLLSAASFIDALLLTSGKHDKIITWHIVGLSVTKMVAFR